METTKNLNQDGRGRDLNPGPPECEPRALPRSHLARYTFIIILFELDILFNTFNYYFITMLSK